jgi:hypothetical protein
MFLEAKTRNAVENLFFAFDAGSFDVASPRQRKLNSSAVYMYLLLTQVNREFSEEKR